MSRNRHHQRREAARHALVIAASGLPNVTSPAALQLELEVIVVVGTDFVSTADPIVQQTSPHSEAKCTCSQGRRTSVREADRRDKNWYLQQGATRNLVDKVNWLGDITAQRVHLDLHIRLEKLGVSNCWIKDNCTECYLHWTRAV